MVRIVYNGEKGGICMKKPNVKQIAFTAIMAALVYVTSAFIQIPIPTAMGATRLHMGNVMCLLSGLLLGPVSGGLAAGLGSVFFDLTNPAYIASAPFTFVFKFLMAFVCGLIALRTGKERVWKTILAAAAGAVLYVALYLCKSFAEDYWIYGMPLQGVALSVAQKGAVSTVNAVLAAVVSVPLFYSLRPLLRRARLL